MYYLREPKKRAYELPSTQLNPLLRRNLAPDYTPLILKNCVLLWVAQLVDLNISGRFRTP